MITKIGISLVKNNTRQNSNIENTKQKSIITSPINSQINWSYYLPFTAKKEDKTDKLQSIMFNADPAFKTMVNKMQQKAIAYGYPEINGNIAFEYMLEETAQYIKDLDSGKKNYKTANCPAFASTMISDYCENVFSEPKQRAKALPVIEKYIKELNKTITEEKPEISLKPNAAPQLSEYLKDAVWAKRDTKTQLISPINFVDAIFDTKDEEDDLFLNFWFDMCDALMLEKKDISKRAPFSDYDNKAKDVLKNLDIGTNVFVTYDFEKISPESFIDTIYKNADKNTKIVEFNKNALTEYFNNYVDKIGKDKNNKYIIIANPTYVLSNKSDSDDDDDLGVSIKDLDLDDDFAQLVKKHPENVKFIFYDTKDNYYKSINLYPGFEETSIPTLNAEQMVKLFKESPNIYKEDIKKPFTKAALEKAVSTSAQIEGKFPQKTITLMKKLEGYNSNKKEISEKDVTSYLKEADYIFKKNNDDSSVEILFDTNKKIKDIVGKNSTKQEALSIVKQIKTNKMGTKGVIIYAHDGYAGGGRRFTAKAIAGEAKIPYIEINAMDFGTKDVDLFGGSSLTPEKSMKKLFSVVTTQAETNKHKSAVLYIENFEYFSIGEQVSSYHQKAMAQLLREMERAEKAGFNILVAGSVSNPNLAGDTMMKSFRFVDQIEVSSPAFNKDERAEIVRNTIKNMKLKLDGDNTTKEDLIQYTADLTQGFPYIYIRNLLKKVETVASEREHRYINKSDMTEAYLQLTTGRPAPKERNEHDKRIITSHECGHATNLEVMNNIAKTLGQRWHIPDKVNFITLDPRGDFGGAVFETRDRNNTISFERMFADIVFGFGGHSSEKYFYGIDGSYGISCDMEMARQDALDMVRVMGMGPKTGKMTILDRNEEGWNESPSDKLKETLESDERVILHNAEIVSDLITEIYADFNREFTEKYSPLVGTGDCMLSGDEFRQRLNEWKARQTPEKQHELELCDQTILEIIEATKRGVEVIKKH